MASLKLLGLASTRAFRCLWMLEEIGVPYVQIKAGPGSKEVRAINPLGKIPVLVDDDFSLYENAAINAYLGDKYRSLNPTLVPPPGTKERALYDQTISVLNTELDTQGLWIHLKHEKFGEIYTFAPDAVAHAKKYFNKTNRSLIQQLKDKGPYLLGADFTAADITYVHCLEWSKGIGWNEKWESEETITEYLELCRSRPAYKKVRELKREEIARSKESNSKL